MGKRSERPIIYLIGTSGAPNYGDELITAGWLRYYAEALPDTEVWVDTPRPGQSAVLHGGIHPKARFVDTLYHGCGNTPSEEIVDVLAFGDQLITEPGLLPREATGIEELSRIALVHVLGGSYISAMWPRNFMLLSAAAGIARSNNIPAVITGAALTPLPDGGHDAIAKTLSGFDVVDVRDAATQRVLSDVVSNLSNTGDDALLYAGEGQLDHQSPHKVLVSIQADMLTEPLERIADYVVRTLETWSAAESRVTVLESLPPDDAAVGLLLSKQLPQVEVLPFSHLWRSAFPAPPRARWITTRYHSHLMGALAGGWGVILPVGGDSTTSSPEDLINLGSGWTIAPDLETPVPANRAAGIPFGGKVQQMRSAKQAIANSIIAKARDARTRQT